MSKPTIVIIAGGANKRFFPFHTSTHKSALPIAGKSLIQRTLENLQENGYEKVVIVVSPKEYLEKGFVNLIKGLDLSLDLHFVVQPEPLGMGDAVLQAKDFLDGQFAVIAPYHIAAGEALDTMLKKKTASVLATTETATPWEYGMVKFDKKGNVVEIVEKPPQGTEPSNQKVSSMYVLSPKYLEILAKLPVAEYNFEAALNILLEQEEVGSVAFEKSFPSLKYPWDLFKFQAEILGSLESFRHPTAKIAETAVIDESSGPVYIDEGAVISHCARVAGPAYIGKNALVGDFSLVRQSNLEEEVKIGVFSEIARAIFFSHTTMHSGFVGDSIIGSKVKIGAGIITANKRIDRKEIVINVGGKKVPTGKTGLGAIIGDGSKIGVRVSFMPGKCVGANTVIYPHVAVTQNLQHEEVLKDE